MVLQFVYFSSVDHIKTDEKTSLCFTKNVLDEDPNPSYIYVHNQNFILFFMASLTYLLLTMGQGKNSTSWIWIYLTSYSHSPCSTDSKNKKMSSEDPREVLPLELSILGKNEAKIQRKWP